MPDRLASGTVAERPNALVLKTRGLIAPGVQIPPVPPILRSRETSARNVSGELKRWGVSRRTSGLQSDTVTI